MPVSFAPVNVPRKPRWGTPPINPNGEINISKDAIYKIVGEKHPVIYNILTTPVGCDLPSQGGISGTLGKALPKPPIVCYLA